LDIKRRDLIIAAGALVLLFGGAIAHLAWQPAAAVDASAAAPVSLTDLTVAGPLGDRTLGKDDAPVTIVEYASLTCPHCAHFEKTTFPELKKRYIDTGKVRYIFREFVLNELDALAIMLARCADKDKYFAFVETLYATQDQWVVQNAIPPLMGIAKQVGFTEDSFKKCAANQQLFDGITAQRDRASNKFGVNSTPTFFINGQMQTGDMSLDAMEKVIQPYLKEK
jgi:protein-disulfide isomerase